MAHIPKGACQINITEIRGSTNTLALRRQDGTFIFNGDPRRPSWPGVYDGAGTKFQYTRSGDTAETINSAGPLREAVDLMLLYQQPNPGIKYEYILPLGDAPVPPPATLGDNPGMTVGGRMILAATSRPGDFVRGPSKLKSLEGEQPQQQQHHHHHNHGGRRRGSHGGSGKKEISMVAAESAGKKFTWKITGYTNCSEPCGGGVQRSIIRCVRQPLGNPVSDRRCSQEQERPPGQVIRCNLKPCPAEWKVGEWGNCSAEECGAGWKTRSVWCEQRISEKLKMKVMEGACLKKKPEVRFGCKRGNCYEWRAGEWSECSAKCGNGVRKRQVDCVEGKTGGRVEQGRCEGGKPGEIRACNMGPCEVGADWFVGEWGRECSQGCGAGVQTRDVFCARQGEEKEGEVYCDEGQRPSEERECFSDRLCGEAQWFTGPWGECSVRCGVGGLRTRQVLCVIFSRGRFKVVGDTMCGQGGKPKSREECTGEKGECGARWFTTDWGECSLECGGGSQKRSVSCRINGSRASTLCEDKQRPLERKVCNEQKCSVAGVTAKPPQRKSKEDMGGEDGGATKEAGEQQRRGRELLEMVGATTTTTTATAEKLRKESSTNSSGSRSSRNLVSSSNNYSSDISDKFSGNWSKSGIVVNSRGGRSSPAPPPPTQQTLSQEQREQQYHNQHEANADEHEGKIIA